MQGFCQKTFYEMFVDRMNKQCNKIETVMSNKIVVKPYRSQNRSLKIDEIRKLMSIQDRCKKLLSFDITLSRQPEYDLKPEYYFTCRWSALYDTMIQVFI